MVLDLLPVPRAGSPFPFVIASEVEQPDATLGPYTACKGASSPPKLHSRLSGGVREAGKQWAQCGRKWLGRGNLSEPAAHA